MAITVISTIKPKNNGNFPIVEAEDVEMPDGTRLSAVIPIVPISEDEYNALIASGNNKDGVLYVILPSGGEAT